MAEDRAVHAQASIGIDVGATFTNSVLFHPRLAALVHRKRPSSPDNPARGVSEGSTAPLVAASLETTDAGPLMHGTTTGIDAIIRRHGARVAPSVSKALQALASDAVALMLIGGYANPDQADFTT